MFGGYKPSDLTTVTQADVDQLNRKADEKNLKLKERSQRTGKAVNPKSLARNYKLSDFKDGKFLESKNGALSGFLRNADGSLKWAGFVQGGDKTYMNQIRSKRRKAGEARKSVTSQSAKRAFNAYYKNRNYLSEKHRKAAVTRDMNYSPNKEEKIIRDKRYLRNPGKWDYSNPDDTNWSDAGPKKMKYTRDEARIQNLKNARNKWLMENSMSFQEMLQSKYNGDENKFFEEKGVKGAPQKVLQGLRDKRYMKPGVRVSKKQSLGKNYKKQRHDISPEKRASAKRYYETVVKPRKQAKRAQKGGNNEDSSDSSASSESDREDQREQHGGAQRAVSLKTAVKLLRNYYANRFN